MLEYYPFIIIKSLSHRSDHHLIHLILSANLIFLILFYIDINTSLSSTPNGNLVNICFNARTYQLWIIEFNIWPN